MDGRKFDEALRQLMQLDLAAGTETFRDDLLARCLDVLGSDDHAADDAFEMSELDDSTLELLAAAGDTSALDGAPHLGDNEQKG